MNVRLCVFLLFVIACHTPAFGQTPEATTLEQRQPLELVFADSIVPQDHHEAMLTTGGRYLRHGSVHDALLTQKIEWGISNRLQISTFANPLRDSNATGSNKMGAGDFEVGARYTWVNVGSPFTHAAVALDAGFPSGNPHTGMGDGAYGLSPSILLSREFRQGRFQAFSTTGFDFVLAHRQLNPAGDVPHHQLFANSGAAFHAGHGWTVLELSINTNRWSGGSEIVAAATPSYIWRLADRTELLFGVPVGLTSAADRAGVVVKFTFELGGSEGR